MVISAPPPVPPSSSPSPSHHRPQLQQEQKGCVVATSTSTDTSKPNVSSNPSFSSSLSFNKERIKIATQRLSVHFLSRPEMDPSEIFSLMFALARGIDYAVSHNDVPSNVDELPSIIKKAYQQKYEGFLQTALLVLLTSLKNACNKKWFTTANSEELLKMADEISCGFCIGTNITSESINCLKIVRQIMPRYFPHLNMKRLLASFEIKAGYDILMADIYIPRNIVYEDQRIRLFVAQSENIASSACIISPPQVSFLLNGKGVEKRTNVSMDSGPQFPTDITNMLKFGLNIFQAIGSFNGNYIVVIALMKEIKSSPDTNTLQDYVHPVVATVMPDTEVIEDSFRISLNCPLSFKRIEIPVKGHLCKHHQCFDFKNYINMNRRNPTWRCPHCNQSVSYIDIRKDQNMAKILSEAGKTVSDVIISIDGTWKVVEGHKSNSCQVFDRSVNHQHEESRSKSEPIGCADDSTNIMDLTEEDDCIEIHTNRGCLLRAGDNACETTDRKPFQDDDSQNIHPHMQISSPSIPLNSSLPIRATNVGTHAVGGIYFPSSFRPIAMRNEPHRTLIPALNTATTRSPERVQGSPVPRQQSQFNSKRPRLGEHVGLPSLISSPSSVQQSRSINATNVIGERSPYLRTAGIPSPLQHNHSSATTMQPISNLGSRSTVTTDTNTIRSPSGPHLETEKSQREQLNSSLNPRSHSHQTSTQFTNTIFSQRVQQTSQMSTPDIASQIAKINHQHHQRGSQMANVQSGSAPPKMPMTATLPQMIANRFRPSSNNTHIHYMTTKTRFDSPQESRNWRPTGRMRGSLSGGAFNEALSRYQTKTVASGSSDQIASTTPQGIQGPHKPAPGPTKGPIP